MNILHFLLFSWTISGCYMKYVDENDLFNKLDDAGYYSKLYRLQHVIVRLFIAKGIHFKPKNETLVVYIL